MKRGWWKLTYEFWDENNESSNALINDSDREHIAKQIEEGMIEGELHHDEDDIPEDFDEG